MPRKSLKGAAVLLLSRAKPEGLYRVNRSGECRQRAASSTRFAPLHCEQRDLIRQSGRQHQAGLPHALQITDLRLAPSMDKVLREQHVSLMSYLSLYQQLSIEFLSDPEFDHGRARDDAFALCAHWRHTHGRHVPTEKISEEFGHWWRRHYTEGLRAAGPTRSYRAFLTHLSNTLDASKRY